MGYSLDLVGTYQAFLALEPEWHDFVSRCEADHPFNTHIWLSSWWRNFGSAEPEVFVVRQAGELVCCVPTMMQEAIVHRQQVRARSLWVNSHSFRSGVLCDARHTACLDDLVHALRSRRDWDIFDLHLLPTDYGVHDAFKAALGKNGLRFTVTPHMDSPRLHIREDWDTFFTGLSRSRRETIRRKVRKLMKRSGATLTILNGSNGALPAALDECWEVSRKTWKHAAGSSIAADENRVNFYSEIAADPSNWIVLSLLHLDGQPVAFEYDLLYKGVLYNLKLGFDETIKALSPGYVLRVKMLNWAFENGVEVYDFMGFSQDYKNQFSNDVLNHEHLRIYNRGVLPWFLYSLEGYVKPLYRRVRQWTARKRV